MHWHLEQTVFPTYTQHQRIKLSASGQELGGSMLFPGRIGFSGTPSDLLPLDLGRCGYELGSDGHMLHVLTDEKVVVAEFVEREGHTAAPRRAGAAAPREEKGKASGFLGALLRPLRPHGVAA